MPTLNLLRTDISKLSIEQWNLISNIIHCYDEHCRLSLGLRYMQAQSTLPLKMRYKAASVMNLMRDLLEGAQSIYQNNQDFLSLCSNDRSILLHSTFKYTGSISVNMVKYGVKLMDEPAYYDTIGVISDPSGSPIARRLADRLGCDQITLKLFLTILSFSTTTFTIYSNTPAGILTNLKQMLDIQNKYIELAWRYLVYKYSEEQAVKYFCDVMRVFLLFMLD